MSSSGTAEELRKYLVSLQEAENKIKNNLALLKRALEKAHAKLAKIEEKGEKTEETNPSSDHEASPVEDNDDQEAAGGNQASSEAPSQQEKCQKNEPSAPV
jgi:hypothetical protein